MLSGITADGETTSAQLPLPVASVTVRMAGGSCCRIALMWSTLSFRVVVTDSMLVVNCPIGTCGKVAAICPSTMRRLSTSRVSTTRRTTRVCTIACALDSASEIESVCAAVTVASRLDSDSSWSSWEPVPVMTDAAPAAPRSEASSVVESG